MSTLPNSRELEAQLTLREAAEVMVNTFGISADEAAGRIARQFKHVDLTNDNAMIGHEDAEFWARVVYYGPSVQWWRVPEETLTPQPWP